MTRTLHRTRRRLPTLAALSVTAVTAAMLGTAPSAYAVGATTVSCTTGSLDLQVGNTTGAVTGTETLSGCTSAGNPALTSGTVTITGHADVRTLLEIVTVTTDTITWNTGQTTTVASEARTITGLRDIIETGTGGTVDPTAEIESFAGTRSFQPGHPGQEMNLIVHAVIGGIPFEIINSTIA